MPLLNLRLANENDAPDLVRMALDFAHNSPYSGLGIELPAVERMVGKFLYPSLESVAFVLDTGEKCVGVLAAIMAPNLFNDRKSAVEVMWWIDPSHRSYKAASVFVEAYEYWAKTAGAQHMALVALDEDHDKLYRRKGFRKAEYTYIKEVN